MNHVEDIRHNNQNTNLKSNKYAIDKEYISKDLTHDKHNSSRDNSTENENRTNIFDSQAGSARLKVNPLKGLSSSIKPNLFKSIGVQVGSGKR